MRRERERKNNSKIKITKYCESGRNKCANVSRRSFRAGEVGGKKKRKAATGGELGAFLLILLPFPPPSCHSSSILTFPLFHFPTAFSPPNFPLLRFFVFNLNFALPPTFYYLFFSLSSNSFFSHFLSSHRLSSFISSFSLLFLLF